MAKTSLTKNPTTPKRSKKSKKGGSSDDWSETERQKIRKESDSEGSEAMEDNRTEMEIEQGDAHLFSKKTKSNTSIDHERPAKKQATKKAGRPPSPQKYQFTAEDRIIVKDWILTKLPETGMDYNQLLSDHFQTKEPGVTAKDLNNLVNKSDHLKGLVKDEHKKVKERKKREFDRMVKSAKANKKVVDLDLSDVPSSASPSLGFVFYKFTSERHYAFVLRHDLGAVVSVDVDDKSHMMEFQITNSSLLKSELAKLNINEFCDGKDLEDTFEFNNAQVINKFSESIPQDADIGNGGRNDHDTRLGGIVEIYFPRKARVNKLAFKGKLFLHLDTEVKTSVPLAKRITEIPNLDQLTQQLDAMQPESEVQRLREQYLGEQV